MRPDQLQRLADLSEKLADVALEECDPEEWSGAGRAVRDLTQQERGDRFWCKKNAAATLSLLQRVEQIRATPDSKPEEPAGVDVDHEISQAERRAADLLNRMAAKARTVGGG